MVVRSAGWKGGGASWHRFIILLCFSAFLVASAHSSGGVVIHVPEEVPTLQMALANTSEGDLIVIGHGYYTDAMKVQPNITIAGIGQPLVAFNITGGSYSLVLERQRPIPDYHYLSYGLNISLEGGNGGITLFTAIPLEEAGVLDPLSIGFYRIRGEDAIPISTTYAVGKEIRVTAIVDQSGIYALLGRRWLPFWPAIQGITIIMLLAAGLAALHMYRRRRRAQAAKA